MAAGDVQVRCRMTVGGSFDAVTSIVSGTLRRETTGSGSCTGALRVDLATLDTGIGLRNEHLRSSYLELEPLARFRAVNHEWKGIQPLDAGVRRRFIRTSAERSCNPPARRARRGGGRDRRARRRRISAAKTLQATHVHRHAILGAATHTASANRVVSVQAPCLTFARRGTREDGRPHQNGFRSAWQAVARHARCASQASRNAHQSPRLLTPGAVIPDPTTTRNHRPSGLRNQRLGPRGAAPDSVENPRPDSAPPARFTARPKRTVPTETRSVL